MTCQAVSSSGVASQMTSTPTLNVWAPKFKPSDSTKIPTGRLSTSPDSAPDLKNAPLSGPTWKVFEPTSPRRYPAS